MMSMIVFFNGNHSRYADMIVVFLLILCLLLMYCNAFENALNCEWGQTADGVCHKRSRREDITANFWMKCRSTLHALWACCCYCCFLPNNVYDNEQQNGTTTIRITTHEKKKQYNNTGRLKLWQNGNNNRLIRTSISGLDCFQFQKKKS